MVEPFCSVYTKCYRPHVIERDIEKTKPCLMFKDLGENFISFQNSKEIYNAERDDALIKELRCKRLISTYQRSYCMNVRNKSTVINPDNLEEDELMVFFNNFYKKKTQPVPEPLYTSRRVFGYCRFNYFYTGMSEYADTISKEGYYLFKKDYDAGKSRLYSKKQQAMQKGKKGEEKPEEKPKPEKEVEAPKPETKPSIEKICVVCCNNIPDVPPPQC